MRSGISLFLMGLLFVLITDFILFLQLKKALKNKRNYAIYWTHSLLFIVFLLIYHLSIPRLTGPATYYWIGLGIGILFLFYTPKLIFIILNTFISLVCRLFSKNRKIGLYIGGTISSLLFLLILYSITIGKTNYKIETTEIKIETLPDAFDNFQIIQLSDLHLGSLSTRSKSMKKLVEKINSIEPDLILFTGDMVNNFAAEMLPWIEELSQLKAKYGKWAIMGNHDYGDYTQWKNPSDKEKNRSDFDSYIAQMDFTLLNNEHTFIALNGDTLYIAGVENWGKPPFPQYGDLPKAIEGIEDKCMVFMTHDPSHWRAEVLDYDIPLTLSGHTHAMQMGFKIGNFEWSPSKYVYPEYDGLYKEGNQYLFVSRGLGFIGFPGRIGLRPEIENLILKK